MKFEREVPDEGKRITRYGREGIIVNETLVTTACILTRERLVTDVALPDLAALDSEKMLALLDSQPDILLIGTGSRQRLPAQEVIYGVMNAGVGIEVMDTPAACRSFNILVAEHRSVAALIYPLDDSQLGE